VDRERVSRLLEEVRESLKVVENIVSLNLSEFIGDVRNRYTLRLGVVEVDDARMYREVKEEGIRLVRRFVEEVERCLWNLRRGSVSGSSD